MQELEVNDAVWIVDLRQYGKVIAKAEEPRSYYVKTNNGVYRRNRWHLIAAPYFSFNNTDNFS